MQLMVLNEEDAKLIAWYVASAFPESNAAAKAFCKNALVEPVPAVTTTVDVALPAELYGSTQYVMTVTLNPLV